MLAADITDEGTGPFVSFRIGGIGVASEKMRITDAGNVGIGTTNPDRKLSVLQSGATWISEFDSSSTTPYGLNLLFSGSSNTTTTFFQCTNSTAVLLVH